MIATSTPSDSRPARRVASNDDSSQRRYRRLMEREIEFIPNDNFRLDFDENVACDREVDALLDRNAEGQVLSPNQPGHLRRMCEQELLTHDQEAALFRSMNYLKYRAAHMRATLDPTRPSRRSMTEIEAMLTRADRVRDQIIRANLRLVISIVKKFVTPQHSFDDLLSDGIFTLMKAVEKFDFDRGFRFSTYAYRSIAREAYRSIKNRGKEAARFSRDAEECAMYSDDQHLAIARDRAWGKLRQHMEMMLQQLDRRERFIIRSRFALGAHRKTRSLRYLGDKLGISKERARQLEKRALQKLQALATEYGSDEYYGAAFV